MQLSDVLKLLDEIAPLRHAEAWDNVGLIVGDPQQTVTRAMLTIDYTPVVASEAREAGCELVIAYHPPIFEAIKRVTTDSPLTELIHDAIRRGVAIYSPHTALDVADGGTNDVLADAIAMRDRSPLRISAGNASSQHKLVTFAPADAVERVSEALFRAGAGRIGDYTSCSFRSEGVGTFFGEAGTDPAVGKAGQLERQPEVRIETVAPITKIEAIVRALRQSHPYEEPAFDLQQLSAPPEAVGIGRLGSIPDGATAEMLVNLLKTELDVKRVLTAGPIDRVVRKAAVCAGSCGGPLLDEAIRARVDLYVTGEMRHHDALKAVRAGVTVVCLLHSNSERAVLKRLKTKLAERCNVDCILSESDRDPFEVL